MPEDPIIAAFVRKITAHVKRIRGLKKKNDKCLGKVRFFPRTWAMGSDARPHNTCTVTAVEGSTLPEVDMSAVDAYDLARCGPSGDHPSWFPLLADHAPGDLLVKQCGKELLIAAGPILVTINFSLEACLAQCSSDQFRRLTAECVPGGNKDKHKSQLLRSFLAPPTMFVPGSRARRSRDVRRLNILLAIESEGTVFFVVDHNRLAKFNVRYRQDHWTQGDINKPSVWPADLGPDWVTQASAAWAEADEWRTRVLTAGTATPIAAVLQKDRMAFNGFGCHTATDVCHELQLHPVTPAYVVCEDDTEWERFKQVLTKYLTSLRRPEVLKGSAGTINSDYPFQFHVTGSRYFINNCIAVFRKSDVRIPSAQWLEMKSKGLFSRSHIIGDDFVDDEDQVAPRYATVSQPVFVYAVGKTQFYTAIQAHPPPDWASGTLHAHNDGWQDLRLAGDTPTIGPQQFHIYNINRVHAAEWSEYVDSLRHAAISEGMHVEDIEPLPLLDDTGVPLADAPADADDLATDEPLGEPLERVKKPLGRPPKMRGSSGLGGRARIFSVKRELEMSQVPLSLLTNIPDPAGSGDVQSGDDIPAAIATRTRKRTAASLEEENIAEARGSSPSASAPRPKRRQL